MRKSRYLSLLITILTACNFSGSPPPRLPELNEFAVTMSGDYMLPQWSPDGKYIAFIADASGKKELSVYSIETKRRWVAASEVDLIYFDWTPQGHLSYLKFRPDLSGNPFPEILDLHMVDLDGRNDHVVLNNLYSPGNFSWFSDERRLVALLSASDSQTRHDSVYLVDTVTGKMDLLVSQQALNVKRLVALSLSSDGTSLAIYGVREADGNNQTLVIIYNIGERSVIKEIVPNQVAPGLITDPALPPAGLSGEHFAWVPGKRWIVDKGYAPEGICYNYNIFFLSVDNPSESFCIATSKGIIAEPALSPDLSHLAFTAVVGPGIEYVMLADLTPAYRQRLER